MMDIDIYILKEEDRPYECHYLKERYDMAFAAFVVDSMRKQNMLKDEKIAELLKDNPDER